MGPDNGNNSRWQQIAGVPLRPAPLASEVFLLLPAAPSGDQNEISRRQLVAGQRAVRYWTVFFLLLLLGLGSGKSLAESNSDGDEGEAEEERTFGEKAKSCPRSSASSPTSPNKYTAYNFPVLLLDWCFWCF
jgi:hypothetical protein